MYYNLLLLVHAIALFFMGFAFTSKGYKVTNRLRTVASIIPHITLGAIIVCAILEKSLILGVCGVLLYFIVPGAGQTVTLLIMGRRKEIGGVSLALTVLFLAALLYVLIYGRVI